MRVKNDIDTKLYFLIGDPLRRTCATHLINSMYRLANLNAVAKLQEVRPEDLGKFCDMVRTFGFGGFCVTMPHKSNVIQYLDSCEEFSEIFSSVNHVRNNNGKLEGVGLDAIAVRNTLEKEGVDIKGTNILMLGAGSVAGPIAAEMCKAGAKQVSIVNRTPSKAEFIADVLNSHFDVKTEVGAFTNEQMAKFAKKADLVLQCTSLGWIGKSDTNYESVEFLTELPKDAVLFDVLYNPPRTKFLARGEELGHKVINGKGMMFNQTEAWMNFYFGIEKMPEGYEQVLEEELRIALTVMNYRLEREGA